MSLKISHFLVSINEFFCSIYGRHFRELCGKYILYVCIYEQRVIEHVIISS